MVTFLIFIAVLAVLVLSHEFGHFIVARKSGMKVYEFGFGFPPRLFSIKKGETIYSINLIPLGGFVKIKGEDGEEPGPDSFVSQKVWKRAITLFAGVGMNIILAFVLLSAGLMVGLPQSVDNLPSGVSVKDSRLQIMEVMSGKPADQAGLQPGDTIIGLDNLENPGIKVMQEYVNNHKDQDIQVTVKRGDEIVAKKIHPFIYADTGKGGLGVSLVEVGLVSYPWHKAIYYGFFLTGFYLKEIVLAFFYLIAGLFVGNHAGEALSGPVGIAVMTGQIARLGFSYLLNFIALLSLNLAIINILPIPALDGGRLLFLLIGKIKRKPIAQKYEQFAHSLGFALLMFLVVVITIKDLGNFKGFFMDLWYKII